MIDIEFDSQEIEKALLDYKFVASLGRGSFGKVFLVTDRSSNEKVAIKKVSC
jgi:serine/threonine protein kinase